MPTPRIACLALLTLLAPAALHAAHTVPFHASMTTAPIPTGSCGPTCITLEILGEGRATHMGRVTTIGPSEIDVITGVQTATATLVAANGDTLIIEIRGTFQPTGPDSVAFNGSWSVTDGTGRFANASGGGSYTGAANGPSGTLIMDGSISAIGRR